ncbi:LysR substrate-binding domain-containing protein [Gluconacetobacter tumulisoli]|uniref:LysR family transcriptional regulator n=1 Tax=Gluconacetobacter tumulisoli TaxID=1286189 RepID=A0A7W4K475_9PROT|nr:LysR substrate-binding domain-containing protein [Gluconacetobacter tumulisoli]MBB2200089.1 LysR family transcriptional regulator [Gluconacetobacter tumulisoli]
MHPPRRFLPSLSLLTAFEAAARTGSITRAAHELSLTQSAVSRQIKALEDRLGVELFTRDRQTIRLTPGGDSYAREIREALRRISTASLYLRGNPYGGTLNLATLPTFGARWLAPRLPAFLAACPGITINVGTRLSYFDFRLESFDAAIHFGQPDWQGCQTDLLRQETAVPVCSPDLARRFDIHTQDDILKAPLLHMVTRPDAWERWLGTQGVAFDLVHGMLFDQFTMVAEACVAGLGVALLPTFLIADELRAGRLVVLFDRPAEERDAYYLVWPAERADYGPLACFRDWILAETAIDRLAAPGGTPSGPGWHSPRE